MKLKKDVHTLVLEGKVESEEIAKKLYKETGLRFMLEKKGQIISGFINTYVREIEGKEYTLVDIFYYDDDIDFEGDEEKHITKYKIRKVDNKDIKTDKINKAFKLAKKEIAIKLIKNLGENNVQSK